MGEKVKILSTKTLTSSVKQIFDGSDIEISERDFIEISFRNLDEEEFHLISKHVVITSKNSVLSILNSDRISDLKGKQVYSVGEVTASLLRINGIEVNKVMNSSAELAQHILKNEKVKEVDFICGNIRRSELPDLLNKNNVEVHESVVYDTFFTRGRVVE